MSKPRLVARARLRWDRIDGRYLLLYPERGLALNESAAAILRLCDGSRTIDGIVTELVAMSRVDLDATVRRDVTAFLDEMRRRGLIEPADGAQDP